MLEVLMKINDDVEDVMRDLIVEWMGEDEVDGVLVFYEGIFREKGMGKLFDSWVDLNKVIMEMGKML